MLAKLAPYLNSMLAGETAYAEPFMGGGSVGLAVASQNRDLKLFINDKDDLVYSFWASVAGSASDVDSLCERLDVQPTVALWDEIKNSAPTDIAGKAFKLVFLNRTSFNGMVYNSSPIGGRLQLGKPGADRVWKIDCQYKPKTLANLIREYHTLLKGRTEVTCLDGVDFMRAHTNIPQFVDPPYFPGDKPNNLYGVQMSLEDHGNLARVLNTCRKFTMTYDFNGAITERFYFGVNTHIAHVRYSASSSRKEGTWKQKSELISFKGFTVTS
jgi:DNA adenine methylase